MTKRPAERRLRGIRILYEDADVIVIEKQAGVLVQETRNGGYCVESALTDYVRKGQLRSRKCVYLVHRLDRETSGVMMVVKSPDVQDWFRSNWSAVTKKEYVACVEGVLEEEAGTYESYLAEDADGYKVRVVADPERGKRACTKWRKLAVKRGVTRVAATLETGRKNQIRVQFAAAGHPVVGDEKYGARKAARLFLHAARLTFRHPHDGRECAFESPVPF